MRSRFRLLRWRVCTTRIVNYILRYFRLLFNTHTHSLALDNIWIRRKSSCAECCISWTKKKLLILLYNNTYTKIVISLRVYIQFIVSYLYYNTIYKQYVCARFVFAYRVFRKRFYMIWYAEGDSVVFALCYIIDLRRYINAFAGHPVYAKIN